MLLRCFQNIGHNIHYKTIISLFIAFVITCSFYMFSPIYAQSQQQGKGVNWLEICRNPLVDALITEPCETLTSPDGYTLTPQGEHVLSCIGGGTLSILTGQFKLPILNDTAGCGGNNGSSSGSSVVNTQQSDQSASSSSSSLYNTL